MKKLIYILILFALFITACKKGDRVENTAYTILDGSENLAFVKFFNATPNSPVVNFFVNNQKTSAGYVTNGKETSGFAYPSVYPDFGYSPIPSGTSNLKINVVGGAAADPNLNVFDGSITTEKGKYYTFFTTKSYNVNSKKIEESFVIADVKPAIDTTKIFVRLVNMFSESPNLDLVQFDTGQKIATNIAFGTSSNFVEIPNPGLTNKYGINVSSTGLPVGSTTLTATLTKGRAYTLVARGLFGTTTFPLGISFYTTFY